MGATLEFKKHNPIGEEEKILVNQVLDSGNLSKFVAEWGPNFLGGRFVKQLESDFQDFFNVKHAISYNSWTSGLIAAVGAIGIEPGDEVIVTPWTMSASAMAILHWNAIPVFADIDERTFCIDPESVISKITEKTKAILSVDVMGQSANAEKLMEIAEKYGLKVISDTAQAPGALRNGKFAGTLTHMGGFSLNYHKHIHAGEGGILVTNDDDLALRARMIRNHAESIVGDAKVSNLSNMVGFNFRMTEIEAAIGVAQLRKLKPILKIRESEIEYLETRLSKLQGLILPYVDQNNTHVYYTYGMRIDPKIIKNTKHEIVEKLNKKGVPNLATKFPNLHLLPIFQEKIAFGKKGFPWTLPGVRKEISYKKGICPVSENLVDNTFFQFYINDFDLSLENLDFIASSFEEVWSTLDFKQ
jgi:dTDP-4-amino-4,6-dideoxygalactose transaminase